MTSELKAALERHAACTLSLLALEARALRANETEGRLRQERRAIDCKREELLREQQRAYEAAFHALSQDLITCAQLETSHDGSRKE